MEAAGGDNWCFWKTQAGSHLVDAGLVQVKVRRNEIVHTLGALRDKP